MSKLKTYEILNFMPMSVFVLFGLCGPGINGCGWATGYFVAASLATFLVILFLFKQIQISVFLVASLVYLSLGALFILLDYRPGYEFFYQMMATGFFAVYFLTLLIQVMCGKFCSKFMEAQPQHPFITLCLYLGVVIAAYLLREQSIWMAILPFIITRFLVEYIQDAVLVGPNKT